MENHLNAKNDHVSNSQNSSKFTSEYDFDNQDTFNPNQPINKRINLLPESDSSELEDENGDRLSIKSWPMSSTKPRKQLTEEEKIRQPFYMKFLSTKKNLTKYCKNKTKT